MWPFRKRISLKDSGIFKNFTDCHSHILPGVDDGVQTMEEALEIHLTAIEPGGQDFVDAILDEEYQMERENEEFVYVNAYDR